MMTGLNGMGTGKPACRLKEYAAVLALPFIDFRSLGNFAVVPFLSREYGLRRAGVRTREENAHSRTVPFLLPQCCVYCQDKSQLQKLKRKYQCQKGSSDKGKHRTETTKVL